MLSVLTCLFVLSACLGIGLLLDRLRLVPLPTLWAEASDLDVPWRLVLATGVGLALGGTAVLACGVVALPPRWLALALTAAFSGVGFWLVPWRQIRLSRDPITWGLLACFGGAVGFQALVAFVPELDIDELTYHLSAPKAWQLAGWIRRLPFEPHSDFHFHSQMISLWSFVLSPSDTISPRLLELGRTTLAALGAGLLAARWGGARLGALTAAFLMANEEVVRFASTAQIDAGQSLYAVLGLGVLGRWLETPEDRRLAVLGSALLGGMLAVKNTGWFLMGTGLFATGAIRLMQRRAAGNWRGLAADVACVGLPWLAIAGPWILRCAINTGNPIYPFWSQRFPVNEFSAPGFHWLQQYYKPPAESSWLNFLPSAGEMYVVRSNARLTSANGAMLWAPLAMVALLLLRGKGDRARPLYWLLALAPLLLIPVQLKTPFSRFFIAAAVVAVAGAMPSIRALLGGIRGERVVLPVVGGLLLWLGAARLVEVMRYTQPGARSINHWRELPPLTLEGRREWLATHEPAGLETLAALDRLPPDALPIVSVTSHAILLAERSFLPNVVCVAQEVVISLTEQGWSDEEMLARLRRDGITHIVTTAAYETPRAREFERRCLTLLEESPAGVRLYVIKSPGNGAEPAR
ncbi:hypothetical protein GC173_00020 [bacterium]|nr:hypothetical protein [bacterium]